MEEKLAVLCFNPLAGDLLTGKHGADAAPAANTRFGLGSAGIMHQDRYCHPNYLAEVTQIQTVADDVVVALTTGGRMDHGNPAITAPLLGASRPDQLEQTLAAIDYKLTPT